ncbi:MAG: cation-translocating P-type ATPase [Thermodesulfovibrionales bacterium]
MASLDATLASDSVSGAEIESVRLREYNAGMGAELRREGMVVCHSTRGRLRIKVTFIRLHVEKADTVIHWLAGQTGVVEAEARPRTGSVIISYDPEKTAPDALIELLQKAVTVSKESGRDHPAQKAAREVQHNHSVCGNLLHLLAITGYSAYVMVRRLVLRSAVSQGPFSLTGVVVAIGSFPLMRHAWQDLRARKGISLFPFLAGTCLLAIIMGEAFTALEVIWISSLSMLLEDYVTDRSRRAIREVLQVTTRNAFVLVEDREREIPVEEVRLGDTVVAHASEKIPVDGIVLRGEALVDEASITGRAGLELRAMNHWVYAGTTVHQGLIYVRAEKVGEETYLNRILQLVQDSLANRAPAEKAADVLAARLVRLGALATVGTAVITGSFIRAFTVLLVVSCPCASALAASTAVSAALANAARRSILIKGGLYLENAGKADCFCFDKTGTLTIGQPRVMEIVPRTARQNPARILALAAAAEAHNTHPLAMAIMQEAKIRDITVPTHAVCEFVLGRGVRATMHGETILVGNAQFMKDSDMDVTYFTKKAMRLAEAGHTVVYVARNGALQGIIGVANAVRPGTEGVLTWLKKNGVSSLILITGDTEPVARAMARDLGFDDFGAALLPEGKAMFVEGLAKAGRRVAMVGDGVNDALAISKAGIGIAMGAGGAEVAIEAADIALMDSNLESLVILVQMSRQTLRVIEQNHWLAVSTNVAGVALGAAGAITPIMGGLLHIVHTLGIMLNSSRLMGWDPPSIGQSRADIAEMPRVSGRQKPGQM